VILQTGEENLQQSANKAVMRLAEGFKLVIGLIYYAKPILFFRLLFCFSGAAGAGKEYAYLSKIVNEILKKAASTAGRLFLCRNGAQGIYLLE